jgi:hypothetical protein
MRDLARILSCPLPSALWISALWTLTGCATMDKMAQDQQAYNTKQCQAFGLTPGSDAYVQCISQGANAYAASRSSQPPATDAPGAAVVPIAIGIPVFPAQPGKNNKCSAPKSAPNGACGGCEVSCGDKQASCSPGEEVPGGSNICITPASCSCQ